MKSTHSIIYCENIQRIFDIVFLRNTLITISTIGLFFTCCYLYLLQQILSLIPTEWVIYYILFVISYGDDSFTCCYINIYSFILITLFLLTTTLYLPTYYLIVIKRSFHSYLSVLIIIIYRIYPYLYCYYYIHSLVPRNLLFYQIRNYSGPLCGPLCKLKYYKKQQIN
jgi:hypothetical protein